MGAIVALDVTVAALGMRARALHRCSHRRSVSQEASGLAGPFTLQEVGGYLIGWLAGFLWCARPFFFDCGTGVVCDAFSIFDCVTGKVRGALSIF